MRTPVQSRVTVPLGHRESLSDSRNWLVLTDSWLCGSQTPTHTKQIFFFFAISQVSRILPVSWAEESFFPPKGSAITYPSFPNYRYWPHPSSFLVSTPE